GASCRRRCPARGWPCPSSRRRTRRGARATRWTARARPPAHRGRGRGRGGAEGRCRSRVAAVGRGRPAARRASLRYAAGMRILVTGGAGYIGSHAARRLLEEGHRVLIVDNLSRGHLSAVEAVRSLPVAAGGRMEFVVMDV